MGGQNYAPAALPLEMRLDIHCTGAWVSPRAGLDSCRKSRPHQDAIPKPSSPYRVTIILYYIILYYIMLCYVILYYIIFIILYYIILYYIILYYIILYYIILYYIILYYIILYYIILYYIILYYTTIILLCLMGVRKVR